MTDAVYDDARAIRDGGGNGSIIGRNTFQRPREDALVMLDRLVKIYLGQGITPSSRSPAPTGERSITARSFPDMADCRLYSVTPPALDPAAFAPLLEQALDAGDVACLQLRLKDVDDDTVRRAIDVLRPITQSRDVAFILNDRPDLAAETGCDGVHVGQSDCALRRSAQSRRPQTPSSA